MITLDDLIEIMRSSAGTEEAVTLDNEIADVPFSDLGFDSLAVLEIQSQIRLRHGIPMSDDSIERMTTPRATVEYANSLRGAEV